MTIKNKFTAFIIATFVAIFPTIVCAQDNVGGDFREIHFSTSVKKFDTSTGKLTGKGRTYRVQYCLMKYNDARDAERLLKDAISKENDPKNMDPGQYLTSAMNQVEKKYEREFNSSQVNGCFSVSAKNGMAFLIIYIEKDANNPKRLFPGSYPEVVEIKGTDTEYEVDLREAVTSLDEFEKTGKGKKRKIGGKTIDLGAFGSCQITLSFEKGEVTENDRLYLQPCLIDCQTEDTVLRLDPRVFEGYRYHSLQNKRKGFDYFKHDPVAPFYVSDNEYDKAKYHHPNAVLDSQKEFEYTYSEKYKKPDPKKNYRVGYTIVIEDFTHVKDTRVDESGSCLIFSPFKFLNYNFAIPNLNIEDFKPQSQGRFKQHNEELHLVFETGTDVLVKDSTNTALLNKLTDELKSHGQRLWEIKVGGAASPEGNIERNKKLAQLRAEFAERYLRKYVSVSINKYPIKVYTWENVADELTKKGLHLESAEVRNIASQYANGNPTEAMKALPYYVSSIEPILSNMRNMRFTYIVEKKKQMNSQEVVDFYYENKEKLKAGKEVLDHDELYKLYCAINNEVEEDTITDIAYKNMLKERDYEKINFNTYIANRKAVSCIKQGTPDMTILQPFIDLNNVVTIDRWVVANERWVNKKELLLNQAIMGFQAMDTTSMGISDHILTEMIKDGELHEKIAHYKNLIYYYLDSGKTPEQEELADQAMAYVLATSDENKAVLYTELREELNKSFFAAESEVNKLADDNPKKWYLKGMLAAQKALGATPKGEVPVFLAYFQHSFDLNRGYRRLYFKEGNVDDKVRKVFPYIGKDANKYRAKFKQLVTDIEIQQPDAQ